MAEPVVAAGRTDKGARPDNQDAILVNSPFFAVADGVGGSADGAVAAETAVSALADFIRDADPQTLDVVEAAMNAHRAVQARAGQARGSDRMATTLTFGSVFRDGDALAVEIAHVGDSRAYLVSDGLIVQLTRDHSFVADLVERGEITPEEATRHPLRSAITRCLGQLEPLRVDRVRQHLRHGDLVLLASDGLNKHLSDDDILEFVTSSESPQDAAENLVEETNRRGGSDNVSVVCVKIDGDGDAETNFDQSAAVRGKYDTAELLIVPPFESTETESSAAEIPAAAVIPQPRRRRRWWPW
ncbi:MAG TPA: protein phosphatase 2C domain-containing protein [Mycobacteriales bacterium]|jgi:protein phosphatase|nr:protein phosphatase 2C domain-containing protein [Mycobacteriales bacterium]